MPPRAAMAAQATPHFRGKLVEAHSLFIRAALALREWGASD
jgi:hypothetical protein